MRQTEGKTRLASALEERYAFFHASCRINLVQREANAREFFSKEFFFWIKVMTVTIMLCRSFV